MSHTTCDCTQAARDAETDIWPNPSAGQLLAAAIAKAADGMGLTSSLLARPAPSEPAEPSEALRDVPASERPSEALPRPIDPKDVVPGMVVECVDRVRVVEVNDKYIYGVESRRRAALPDFESSTCERVWWLIEDAPQVDEDDAVIERVAQVLHKQGCSWCDTGEDLEAHYGSAREAWREDARAVLAVVREHTVTARAEQ